jgi:Tfp pilus assembly protein PilF
LDSGLSRAHNNLGLLLARTEREAEAMQAFAMAGASPAEASANLAFAMALDGRVEQAIATYRQALQFDPNLKTAREGLAALESLSTHRLTTHVAPAQTTPPGGWWCIRRIRLPAVIGNRPEAVAGPGPRRYFRIGS